VVRGGSWNNNQNNARAAYRNYNDPADRNNNIGFRVVGVVHSLNHVSYGDTWGLRRHIFSMRALRPCRRPRPR
jgi:hypothetical protein